MTKVVAVILNGAHMWQQWINGILGIWTIIAAWTYMAAGTGRTVLIITGIVVAILAFWSASTDTAAHRHGPTVA